jgi:hypothetical protein
MIVEDGSIVDGADSYVSLSYANNYFASRGNTDWQALTDSDKEYALVNSTDYIETIYWGMFVGEPVLDTQILSFPRIADEFASDSVPDRLMRAVCELAMKNANGIVLIEDSEQRVIKEKVDVIETTYSSYGDDTKRFNIVARLISPLLTSGSASSGEFTQVTLVRT